VPGIDARRCSAVGSQRAANFLRGLLTLQLLLAPFACGGEEVIVKTADGVNISAADLDKDPLRLLPPGALGLTRVEVSPVVASVHGARLLALSERVLPIPPSARFSVARDVDRFFLGVYSFSGVDFGGVASGRFDVAAISKAAQSSELTPLGTPLVHSRYAKWELYTSANIGFCLLTSHTAVFGNETGIRRILDRLERGELDLQLGKELKSLLEKPDAPIAFGVDAKTDPQVQTLAQQAEFLQELELLRGVANLEPPGLNVAATFTYPNEKAVGRAKQSFEMFSNLATGLGFVQTLTGGRPLVTRLETKQTGLSLQVQAAADATLAEQGIQWAEGRLGPKQTANASHSLGRDTGAIQ
jgi:hypothetical protein